MKRLKNRLKGLAIVVPVLFIPVYIVGGWEAVDWVAFAMLGTAAFILLGLTLLYGFFLVITGED